MSLVFLVEDASMAALQEALLPRLVPADVGCKVIPHKGKSDLARSIPRKLRAWRDPAARFVILRDQDSADCRELKRQLVGLCGTDRPLLVRIACRELEAWYLADLAAVDRAFGTRLAGQQRSAKYRRPDRLGSPSHEVGRLVPGFGKVSSARALGPQLDLENERSPSFRQFVVGVRRLVASPQSGSQFQA